MECATVFDASFSTLTNENNEQFSGAVHSLEHLPLDVRRHAGAGDKGDMGREFTIFIRGLNHVFVYRYDVFYIYDGNMPYRR